MDDRAVSTVQTVLAETRWLPTPCPTEYLPALARDVLWALKQERFAVVQLPAPADDWHVRAVGTVGIYRGENGVAYGGVYIGDLFGPDFVITASEARSFAAALIAAAESVSVVATPAEDER